MTCGNDAKLEGGVEQHVLPGVGKCVCEKTASEATGEAIRELVDGGGDGFSCVDEFMEDLNS